MYVGMYWWKPRLGLGLGFDVKGDEQRYRVKKGKHN